MCDPAGHSRKAWYLNSCFYFCSIENWRFTTLVKLFQGFELLRAQDLYRQPMFRQILQTFRRLVVLVSLMFWQGGFMFYGGIVVSVGSRVLGSDTQQGFITQSVTDALNTAGFVCLIIWGANLWWERRDVFRYEWLAFATTFALLIALVVIHLGMDRVLDIRTTVVTNHQHFGRYHKLYIGISSVQWLLSLLMLFGALLRWNRGEVNAGESVRG